MKSMTGFGRAKININQREYNVEIKSVNHKYCDINVKAPRNLIYLEDKIKKQISNKISRGKFDVFVSFYDFGCEKRNLSFNKELAKLYIKELKSLANETNVNDEIQIADICRIPELMQIQISREGEEEIEK